MECSDELRAYLRTAMQRICTEARWARHFPQKSLDRIGFLAGCVAELRELPPDFHPRPPEIKERTL